MSIQVLPTDCLMHIFSFLEAYDLTKRVSLVCRKWRENSNADCFWKQLCVKDFSKDFKFDDHLSWKDLYHVLRDHKKEFQGVQRRMLVGILEDLESGAIFLDPAFGVKC